MSKHTLLIQIETDGATCDDCALHRKGFNWCFLFLKTTTPRGKFRDYPRLPECLEAERKAKKPEATP